MTGNKSYLSNFIHLEGPYVIFVGGKISGKGTIRTGNLDFEDVYYIKERKYNIFSVSQMCDKKNKVLFTETECLVLTKDFKKRDETYILIKIPRKCNLYSVGVKL